MELGVISRFSEGGWLDMRKDQSALRNLLIIGATIIVLAGVIAFMAGGIG
jgi:hypothetical protein